MASCWQQSGFTLVEVVLVLLMIGVMAAIAMPRFGNSLAMYRVDAASKRLVADFAMVREQARHRSKSITVFLVEGATSSYTLQGIIDPDRPQRGDYTIELWKSPYLATLSKVDIGGDLSIVFDGFGVPDSSGELVVSVGTLTRTIQIDALTGEMRILPE